MSGESLSEVALPNTRLHHLVAQNIPDQSYELRMALPPSYSDSPDARYPVLYLLDGDICFGMAVDIVRHLIFGTHIPEILIAAVGYGSYLPPEEGGQNMRAYDFAPFEMEGLPEPRGEAYHLFLQDELIPFVESTYRTDAAVRALFGYSLSGLFGLNEMFQHPSLFSRYILVSPPLQPSTAEIFVRAEQFVASKVKFPATMYICGGELDPILPWFTRLTAILDKASMDGFSYEWEVFPRGDHVTAPAEALAKGLRATLGKKSICEVMYSALQEGGIDSAISLYHDLKGRESAEYDFSEGELNKLGYVLLYHDKVQDAIDVLELNVATYPEAWNTYDSLGEAYMVGDHTALAIKNYEMSVDLNPKNEVGIAWIEKLKSLPESQASK
jgi:predicted alpha/beta superfamily hydrolase